jgi:cobalt/nickel transport system permease protein
VRPQLLDQWSRRSSPIHRLAAGMKLAALLATLMLLSLAAPVLLAAIAVFLLGPLILSALPIAALLKRAALVLPFSAILALAAWFSGDSNRAASMLTRSYLSVLAALLFAATTTLPAWTATLRSWRVPETLISTIQFTYRYLFVLAEEAQTMAMAARARGGFRFTAAAGALAVLFARSWQRAEAVHRAMLARGYQSAS